MKHVIVVCLLFIIFLAYYFRVSVTLPITYYDEAWWIGSSYFYDLRLHDIGNPLWNTVWSYDQPKLTHYIFGMLLYPEYLKVKKDTSKTYISYLSDNHLLCRECIGKEYVQVNTKVTDLDQFTREITSKTYIHTREIIFRIRKFSAFVSALTVVVVYVMGISMWGSLFAVICALLYGFNSLVIHTTLLAHADAIFLLFYTSAIAALFIYLKNDKVIFGIIFGVLAGIASSTKLIGLTLLVIYVVCMVQHIKIQHVRNGIWIVLVAIGIFITLNPFLYHDSVNRIGVMISHRVSQQQAFQQWYPEDNLPTISVRFFAFIDRFFGVRVPYKLLMSTAFILGIVSYIRRKSYTTLLIGYCTIAMMLGWLSVAWDRYYLLAVWFVIATEVEGIWFLVHRKWSFRHFVAK